eukprot:m.306520 g.306520  ORF g.306520 m.306520 type:complete len:315 (-) comp27361_c1_seq1:84-1028(-)
MDRVSSQLLRSAVTDALVSAGFDGISTVGVESSMDTEERGAPEEGGPAEDMDVDGEAAAEAPEVELSAVAVAWGDCCSMLAKEAEVRLVEIAKKAKLAAELQGRTEVNAADVAMALEYKGISVSELLEYTQEYEKGEAQTPSAVVDRCPDTTADMSEEFMEDPERKLYDEKHRQKRPAIVADFMPQFPEPHTYMRTPVYFPPMTDYVEWRTKEAQLKAEQQDAVIHFAASITEPPPKPLVTQGGARCNVPVIARPRVSTPYYAYHMSERDWRTPGKRRAENDPPGLHVAENAFLLKESLLPGSEIATNPLGIDV